MRLRRDGRSHVELIERIAQRTSAARDGDEALRAAVTEICRWTGFPLGHAYLVERDPELPLPPSGLWHGTAPHYRPLIAADRRAGRRRDDAARAAAADDRRRRRDRPAGRVHRGRRALRADRRA